MDTAETWQAIDEERSALATMSPPSTPAAGTSSRGAANGRSGTSSSTRTVPVATMSTVADMVKVVGFPLHAKQRVAGLRLSATDTDWSAGDGPPVSGPLASLVLAMAGRKAVLQDLSGEGTEILRARM